MTIRIITAAIIFSIAFAVEANASPSAHAGEWETVIGDGPSHLICLQADRTFDQASMTHAMQTAGVKCGPGDWHDGGTVITYNTVCDVAGGKMTTHSTITITGPDSYTTHSTSHLEGGSMKISDMDMTQTARRIGPCKPGDKPSRF